MSTKLKYEYTDSGYCRVVFSYTGESQTPAFFCAQEERPGLIVFYRCTDDWHEPISEFKLKAGVEIPLSPGDTDIDRAVNEWIQQKWSMENELTKQ